MGVRVRPRPRMCSKRTSNTRNESDFCEIAIVDLGDFWYPLSTYCSIWRDCWSIFGRNELRASLFNGISNWVEPFFFCWLFIKKVQRPFTFSCLQSNFSVLLLKSRHLLRGRKSSASRNGTKRRLQKCSWLTKQHEKNHGNIHVISSQIIMNFVMKFIVGPIL